MPWENFQAPSFLVSANVIDDKLLNLGKEAFMMHLIVIGVQDKIHCSLNLAHIASILILQKG